MRPSSPGLSSLSQLLAVVVDIAYRPVVGHNYRPVVHNCMRVRGDRGSYCSIELIARDCGSCVTSQIRGRWQAYLCCGY